MRIVHINTSDYGGAANSCIRLHQALLQIGLDSMLITVRKSTSSISNHLTYSNKTKLTLFQRIKLRLGVFTPLYVKQKELLNGKVEGYEHFSFTESEFDLHHFDLLQNADIINLHWVAGFINYSLFFDKIKKPIVWTLHDMNPFTGGCHYATDCIKYIKDCNNCPQLSGTINPNLTHLQLIAKKIAISNANISIVSPSVWLQRCAQRSLVLKNKPIYLIPYSLNLEIFKPINQFEARQKLGLPPNKKIILFVSQSIENRRKGFEILSKSFSLLNNSNDYLLCSVGKKEILGDNLNCISLGELKEEEQMALAYNAADVFVIPSSEDNLPNTAIESVACGVPVIAFNIGGLPDIIKHGFNGLLAQEVNPEKLSNSIELFFSGTVVFDKNIIRKDAEERYNNKVQAKNYNLLYNSLIKEILI